MQEVLIRDDFIKLGQALKLSGICTMGTDAKALVTDGNVKVNGEVELRRGRKLYDGDVVETGDVSFVIRHR